MYVIETYWYIWPVLMITLIIFAMNVVHFKSFSSEVNFNMVLFLMIIANIFGVITTISIVLNIVSYVK